jgi:alcohol dehydrogenase
MNAFEFQLQTKIIFGCDSVRKLSETVAALGAHGVFVLLDPAVRVAGSAASIFESLEGAGIRHGVFDRVEPEPSIESVQSAFGMMREGSYDALLAVGGGSCIDTAKAVAILATNPGRLQDFAGWNKFDTPPLPLIAVPTTAGTGSEVTDAAVITDKKQNVKFTIKHDRFSRPAVAILDPHLLATVPKGVAATTGFDALAHAVESYTSLKATPYLEALSLKAIELVGAHLTDFVRDRTNADAAAGMILASNMAGISFPVAGTGNCHCIARFVGARYPISHGMCCAVILPHVMEFNHAHAVEKFTRISRALNAGGFNRDPAESAREAVSAVKALARSVGLPATFRELDPGVDLDVEWLADESSKSWYNQYNPRFTTKADFSALIRQIAG